jgi:hypothetical protein
VLLFAAIVASLASAALALVRRRQDPKHDRGAMVRALTVRISLSVLLFVLLMLGWAAGLIEPHGVVP